LFSAACESFGFLSLNLRAEFFIVCYAASALQKAKLTIKSNPIPQTSKMRKATKPRKRYRQNRKQDLQKRLNDKTARTPSVLATKPL